MMIMMITTLTMTFPFGDLRETEFIYAHVHNTNGRLIDYKD